MSRKYELIMDYIYDCYINDDFDLERFEFYKLRKEKDQHRIGIYTSEGRKYFFKMVNKSDFNDECIIKDRIKPYFKIVKKYSYKQYDNLILNLYECINTVGINAFNYLRNRNISIDTKKEKIDKFFEKYILMQKTNIGLNEMQGDRLSDMWFHSRIRTTGRVEKYYGKGFQDLLLEIKKNYSAYYSKYYEFITTIDSYIDQKNLLIESYTHGDFHDFNFSLDGLFWDIETFGINPIMNDFVIYYWHFYGREDGLIYKYSPWLVTYMHNELDKEELKEVRKLKEDVILYWYSFIEETYKKYNIETNIKKEFVFKLFCRMFLIDNILGYEKDDKTKVIEFFYHFLDNSEKDIKSLLFSSNVKF